MSCGSATWVTWPLWLLMYLLCPGDQSEFSHLPDHMPQFSCVSFFCILPAFLHFHELGFLARVRWCFWRYNFPLLSSRHRGLNSSWVSFCFSSVTTFISTTPSFFGFLSSFLTQHEHFIHFYQVGKFCILSFWWNRGTAKTHKLPKSIRSPQCLHRPLMCN